MDSTLQKSTASVGSTIPISSLRVPTTSKSRFGCVFKKDTGSNENPIVIDFKDKLRDCKFSKVDSSYLAVSLVTGYIKVYDLRNLQKPVRSFYSAQNDCWTVGWHPSSDSILASGGMDKFIHLWDMNNERSDPLMSFKTSSGVSRIKFWDKKPNCIIASYQTSSSYCSIWNCDIPYIPEYNLLGHKDVVTGFEMDVEGRRLISCSRDKFLLVQPFESAVSPLDNITNAVVQIGGDDFIYYHSSTKMEKSVESVSEAKEEPAKREAKSSKELRKEEFKLNLVSVSKPKFEFLCRVRLSTTDLFIKKTSMPSKFNREKVIQIFNNYKWNLSKMSSKTDKLELLKALVGINFNYAFENDKVTIFLWEQLRLIANSNSFLEMAKNSNNCLNIREIYTTVITTMLKDLVDMEVCV